MAPSSVLKQWFSTCGPWATGGPQVLEKWSRRVSEKNSVKQFLESSFTSCHHFQHLAKQVLSPWITGCQQPSGCPLGVLAHPQRPHGLWDKKAAPPEIFSFGQLFIGPG